MFVETFYIRFKSHFDLTAIVVLVDEGKHAWGDGGPLDGKWCQQQVEPNAAVAIATEKGHEKAKTGENHHMDILKDCEGWERNEW